MAAPNIRIDIASVFKDKGFKQASKSSTALERQFKSLGRTFLTVFSTAAIIRFGKESAKAFAEDEKAARRLEQTLKGVNLGFAAPQVESYISSLEKSTGILDDDLRPALEALVRTTGTVTTAQTLLSTAIEVSAGSGYSLVTVASDLAKAYVGNTRGLAKYNTGLTKAELQTKSFAEIQKVLNDQFTGQRAAYLSTYAGRTEALRVAYANMQETIGKGLVDAFIQIQGDNGIGGATKAMEDFGDTLADIIRGLGLLLDKTNEVTAKGGFNLFSLESIPIAGSYLRMLQKAGQSIERLPTPPGNRITFGMNQAKIAEAEKDAIERAKAIEAQRKKSLAAQEKSNKLKALAAKLDRSAAKFDLERIQIAAALQGKISEGDRIRLQEMQTIHEARQAIAEGDLEASNKLIEALEALGEKFLAFQEKMEKTKQIDPFSELPKQVEKANEAIANLRNIPLGSEGDYVQLVSPKYPNQPPTMVTPPSFTSPNIPSVVPPNTPPIVSPPNTANPKGTAPNVSITVNGALDPNGVANQINEILNQGAATSGTFTRIGYAPYIAKPTV